MVGYLQLSGTFFVNRYKTILLLLNLSAWGCGVYKMKQLNNRESKVNKTPVVLYQ